MKKYDSLILDKMLNDKKVFSEPIDISRDLEYSIGGRGIEISTSGPIFYNVAYGDFCPTLFWCRSVPSKWPAVCNENYKHRYYLWLPDGNHVCKITKKPAPFNKFFGALCLESFKEELLSSGCSFLLHGLNRTHTVQFNISDD